MRCDGSPDPTVPGEINTYINLRLEDNENDSIEMVLKKCELDSSVSIGRKQTEHLGHVAHLFIFLCCPIMCILVFSYVLWCPLRFMHKSAVQFVFTSSCL